MAIMDPQHSDTLWPASGEVCGAVCGKHAHTYAFIVADCAVCGPCLPPLSDRSDSHGVIKQQPQLSRIPTTLHLVESGQ